MALFYCCIQILRDLIDIPLLTYIVKILLLNKTKNYLFIQFISLCAKRNIPFKAQWICKIYTSLKCILHCYGIHCTVYTVYSVQCTLYNILCKLYNIIYKLQRRNCLAIATIVILVDQL